MYLVKNINKAIWKLAKSDKEINFDTIKEAIREYTQNSFNVSEYDCVTIISQTVGDAVENGVITSYMFTDSIKSLWDPVLTMVFGPDNSPIELKLIRAMLNMIRFVPVVSDTGEILIDFGQYE